MSNILIDLPNATNIEITPEQGTDLIDQINRKLDDINHFHKIRWPDPVKEYAGFTKYIELTW